MFKIIGTHCSHCGRSGFFRSLFSKDDRTTVVSLGGRYYSNRTSFIINDTAVRTLRGMLGAG